MAVIGTSTVRKSELDGMRGVGMTVPVRLDSLVFPRLRSAAREGGPSAPIDEPERQFLFGVWLLITALTAGALLLVILWVQAVPVAVFSALLTAVPGSMFLLRGVVDGFSAGRRSPKYTISTAVWTICYAVAAGALLLAFVA
jgi:hypothetical protein